MVIWRPVQRVLGAMLSIFGLIYLPPIVFSWVDGDQTGEAFLVSAALVFIVGSALFLTSGKSKHGARLREGILITVLCWVCVCIAASLPFILAPPHLPFIDALFEATSGITTTGATLITGLDELPRSVLFYRQSLHFVGGMGIVILAVAILPMIGGGGMQLFRAEISGTVRDHKLAPRVADTARLLWKVYLSITVLCAVFYWAAGMNLFDAVGHAFSTVATAGFSTHDASIAHYDNALIEMVAMVFMVAGGINFSRHFLAWRRGSFAPYREDVEMKIFIATLASASAVCAIALYVHGEQPELLQAIRHGSFQVIASMTTTGLSTESFYLWPGALPFIIILISFTGGCAGSTTGGIKLRRVGVLLRMGKRELSQLLHPKAYFVVRAGGQAISEDAMRAVAGFIALYLITLAVLITALASTGLDLLTAASSAAACLNNLGPALGVAGPHFQGLNDAATFICSIAMLLGRLEVMTLLILLTPAFWRSN